MCVVKLSVKAQKSHPQPICNLIGPEASANQTRRHGVVNEQHSHTRLPAACIYMADVTEKTSSTTTTITSTPFPRQIHASLIESGISPYLVLFFILAYIFGMAGIGVVSWCRAKKRLKQFVERAQLRRPPRFENNSNVLQIKYVSSDSMDC